MLTSVAWAACRRLRSGWRAVGGWPLACVPPSPPALPRGRQRRWSGWPLVPPGAGIPLHTHNVEESVFLVAGQATAVIGEDSFDLEPGDATWAPAGVPHRFVNRGETPMRIYWVYGGREVTRTICATGEDRRAPVRAGPRRRGDAVMGVLRSVDPATGEELASYPAFTATQIDAAVGVADEAQQQWRRTAFDERRGCRHIPTGVAHDGVHASCQDALVRAFHIAERRARLSRRHHLSPEHRVSDVVAASDGVVCLHATDPAAVYLSAWARVDGLSVADVDEALYIDRSLVKHLAMRRTLFVFRRELLGVIQSAASRRVADQERRRLAKDVEAVGLVPDGRAWLAQASEATLEALDVLGEATSSQLRQTVHLLRGSTVYAPDKPYGGSVPVAPRVLTTLSANGQILRASNRGGWTASRPTWSRTSHWLGEHPVLPPEREARAELVRRWLYAFGPATVADLRWWLGSPLTAVRAALADVGAIEVDLNGQPGVALSDDLDPVAEVEPYAALLPMLDPTTMGWAERGWYLGPHRPQLFDSSGNAGPTAWWDGRIVGGWSQSRSGEVVLRLLEDVGQEGTTALQAEAARLTDWLDGVRVVPRFPSPVWRLDPPPKGPLP